MSHKFNKKKKETKYFSFDKFDHFKVNKKGIKIKK